MPCNLTVSFHQSAVSSVGALHKAIRDGDYEIMREKIEQDPTLIMEPNSIGWTVLHFCASHQVPFSTWKWLLMHDVLRDCSILEMRTDNGQNCVDHFFRLYLDPMEWQRHNVKEAAKDLKESIESILQDTTLVNNLRSLLDGTKVEDEVVISSNKHFKIIIPFWRRMHVLLQCVDEGFADAGRFSIVHALAATGCPREVGELAVNLYPCQTHVKNSGGYLPLHLACLHEGAENMIDCLLPLYSARPDPRERLPLHLALISGKTWEKGVSSLWKACPLYGGTTDSKTGFPAFLLASMPDERVCHRETQAMAAENFGGMLRFMPAVSQVRALSEARSRVELRHLNTIFQLLRAAPNAIDCCLKK